MTARPQIKTCGVADASFAVAAERLGVDYIGFIFAKGSPRRVAPDFARRAAEGLAGTARTVGVFTGGTAEEIAAVMRETGLDIVQLHRRADAGDVAALKGEGFEVWTLAGGAPGDAVLFDSSHGDGETQLRRGPWRTVLAGGISSENLADALRERPDIIDVNSSLETAPGEKSIVRLEAFLARLAELTP